MSEPEPYCAVEAFIEHDQVDWCGDGVAGQLVTVMMSDDHGLTRARRLRPVASTGTQARV